MDVRFHALVGQAPDEGTLAADARFTTDARQASRNFAVDALLAVVSDDELVPVGARLRLVGHRSIARHGASALDTDLEVRLYAFDGQDLDAEPTLSRAMLMVSLGLATAEAPTVADAWSEPLVWR